MATITVTTMDYGTSQQPSGSSGVGGAFEDVTGIKRPDLLTGDSSGDRNAFKVVAGTCRTYPLFDGDPYFEDARDLFGSSCVDFMTYQEHIYKYRQLPDPCPPCGVYSCLSYDYFPHLVHGGTVVKQPQEEAPPGYRNNGTYPESRGPTAVAILLREGVVFAVNHHSSGPALSALIGFVGPRMIATISGGEVGECTRLLHDLLEKCREEISVEDTLQLMTKVLSSRLEVGLIAGWDGATDRPFLYRVDGSGGLIESDILATGYQFRGLYAFLDLNCMMNCKRFYNAAWLDSVVDDVSQYEKYAEWSHWAVHEAEKMALIGICDVAANDYTGKDEGGDLASVFYVGRDGVRKSYSDQQVDDTLQEMGMPPPQKLVRLPDSMECVDEPELYFSPVKKVPRTDLNSVDDPELNRPMKKVLRTDMN